MSRSCDRKENLMSRKSCEEKLREMQAIAKERGGQCLSTEYVNSSTPLIFKCGNPEHEPWSAISYTVKNRGTWCKRCADEAQRLTPEEKGAALREMQAIAKERGGQCLSTEYVNSSTPLIFKCGNPEHEPWSTSPHT